MRYYINPEKGTKEEWLVKYGRSVHSTDVKKLDWEATSEWPVCWVDNGMFTAAGIGFCQEEVEVFARPDWRRKRWYMVPKVELVPFCSLAGSTNNAQQREGNE